MSDVATELVPTEETAPPRVIESDSKPEKKKPKEGKADAKEESREEEIIGKSGPVSSEIKALRLAEDRTLREMIETFGTHTAYKVRVTRIKPEHVTLNGKKVATSGFLEWVEGQPIDEEWLQEKYGGGKYELSFRKRGPKGGWEYGGQVTTEVAGAPSLENLPGGQDVTPAPAAAAAGGEAPSVVTRAMDFMAQQVTAANQRAEKGGGGSSELVELMREQLHARDSELAAMRGELRDAIHRLSQPPPKTKEDEITGRLLDKMIDQDSARIQALRTQYESEIRQIKDNAREDDKRAQDRHEREMQQQRMNHEREIAMLRQSHETSLATLKSSHEVALASAQGSFTTQAALLQADNKRLERDNNELREEVKELRAKKEKSLPEQIKEMKALKELVTGDDDSSESSGIERVVEAVTNPETIAAVGSIFKKGQQQAEAAQAQAVAQAAPRPQRPQVVKDRATGQKFILKNGELLPAKKMPPPGTPPEVAALPEINPDELKMVVNYLENACTAGTDPGVVVQSFGPHVPEPIRVAIRDLGGVDQFLIKVAKLPSSSPLLANQAGKNWCRKLGKALAGE